MLTVNSNMKQKFEIIGYIQFISHLKFKRLLIQLCSQFINFLQQ